LPRHKNRHAIPPAHATDAESLRGGFLAQGVFAEG
jgi:hypothetical protein